MLTKDDLIQRFQLLTPKRQQPSSWETHMMNTVPTLKQASVLVGFIQRNSDVNVLFTTRANHLKHHPGQVSFPGGKYEQQDKSLAITAMRETQEEVGIAANQIQIFGKLNTLITTSQFQVTPYLAFIDNNYQAKINTNEVANIFEVPASYLFDQTNLVTQAISVKSGPKHISAIMYDKHLIWGVTGRIISELTAHLSIPSTTSHMS